MLLSSHKEEAAVGAGALLGLALLTKKRRPKRGPSHKHKKSSVPPPKPDPAGDRKRQDYFEKRKFALQRQKAANNPKRKVQGVVVRESRGPGIEKVSDAKIRKKDLERKVNRDLGIEMAEAVERLIEFVDPRPRNRYGQFDNTSDSPVTPENASAAYRSGQRLGSRLRKKRKKATVDARDRERLAEESEMIWTWDVSAAILVMITMDSDHPLYELFYTNYSPNAYFAEERRFDEVDLKTTTDHEACVGLPVTLPAGLRTYLDSDPEHQFTTEEIDAIEAAVERYHNLSFPYAVHFEPQQCACAAFCELVRID
jgi:hypothetical protein